MWTQYVTWFSNEVGRKGQIQACQLADLIVPSRDYFACAEDEIAGLTSDLTIVGGKVVYAAGVFAALDETPPPPAMPDWSPVRQFGGYAGWRASAAATRAAHASGCAVHAHVPVASADHDSHSLWGALGCSCWAF
jgi:hypothetical protein